MVCAGVPSRESENCRGETAAMPQGKAHVSCVTGLAKICSPDALNPLLCEGLMKPIQTCWGDFIQMFLLHYQKQSNVQHLRALNEVQRLPELLTEEVQETVTASQKLQFPHTTWHLRSINTNVQFNVSCWYLSALLRFDIARLAPKVPSTALSNSLPDKMNSCVDSLQSCGKVINACLILQMLYVLSQVVWKSIHKQGTIETHCRALLSNCFGFQMAFSCPDLYGKASCVQLVSVQMTWCITFLICPCGYM